jgi:DeoR family transcriptional regulator, aga operon transcriptional repressor
MAIADRDDRLLALVGSHGRASVRDLASDLGVGTSTIRRDLARLERAGCLVRTYGGAALARSSAGAPGNAVSRLEAKRGIAAAASALVRDGQTIAISSGTTALEFARCLAGRRELTVITNALDVVRVLLDADGIQLVVLGGVVRAGMHSLLGHLTEQACREVRADSLFMGIGAIDLERGLMNDFMPEILTDRALRTMATQVVVLADSSKFEQVAPGFLFGLDQVDTIVTDAATRPETLAALAARGIRVVVAQGPTAGRESVPAFHDGPRNGGGES